MWDGDMVAVALMRRAEKNEKLREAIEKTFNMGKWRALAEEFRHVPTRKLSEMAREERARAQAESDAFFARLEADRAAERAEA
jgi:predicted RNA-binding protein